MKGGLRANIAEIRRALDVLVEPASVVELRALQVPNGRYTDTCSGYFNDMDEMAKEAARLSDAGAKGTYLTLNPVKPALLARSANRAREVRKDPTTGDHEVERRARFLVDVDPVRPSGISSNTAEHDAALERAREIAKVVRREGWPDPVIVDSGNGAQLLYRIGLLIDDGGLIRRVLEALALCFDDDAVKVDVVNSNPARIVKLPGTVARKGDSTADRPHRLSTLLYVPDVQEIISDEKLGAVAAWKPEPDTENETANGRNASGNFHLGKWIEDHHVPVGPPSGWREGGTRWVFDTCPFNSDHKNRSAVIVLYASGKIGFRCHHNGCAGKGWKDLRLLFEPDAYSERQSRKARSTTSGRASDDRAQIDTTDEDGRKLLNETLTAIVSRNARGPVLFRTGTVLTRIVTDADGRGVMEPITSRGALFPILVDSARFFRRDRRTAEGRERDVFPPRDLVDAVISIASPPVPQLNRVVTAPVFAADGSLGLERGYFKAARVWHEPPRGVELSAVPDSPTEDEIAAAREVLLFPFADFRFQSPADRAHMIALVLSPFVREMIGGPTPLYLIEKPDVGSGASLLVDVAAMIALGSWAPLTTAPKSREEWLKTITAKLLTGSPLLVLDNLPLEAERTSGPYKGLLSDELAAAITGSVWHARVLGTNHMPEIPIRTTWIATANNPTLSREMLRRTARIRLSPDVERPFQRKSDDFAIPDLREYVTWNRVPLVYAVLLLVQAWIAAGQPKWRGTPLGSFESWSKTIGGILEVVGIEGFLGNVSRLFEEAETDEDAVWASLVQRLWKRSGSHPFYAVAVLEAAHALGPEVCGGLGLKWIEEPEARQRIDQGRELRVVGNLLRARLGRVFGVVKLARLTKKRKRGTLWRLVDTTAPSSEAVPPIDEEDDDD